MKALSRERTHTWADLDDLMASMIASDSHIGWLRKLMAGEVPAPPAASTMGFRPEAVQPGHVVFSMTASEWMANPLGVVHGGITSTLLDTVLTLCVLTELPQHKACTTIGLNVHFVRPLLPTGETVTAEGTAVHVGTTLATSEGRVYDSRGRVIAHGTSSLAVIDASTMDFTKSRVRP